MKRILTTIGAGRLIVVALIAGVAVGALVAAPLFAAARGSDDEPNEAENATTLSQVFGEVDQLAASSPSEYAAKFSSGFAFGGGSDEIMIAGSFEDSDNAGASFRFEMSFGEGSGMRFGADLIETVAELTNTEDDAVAQALEEGQTLAEYAAEHGVSEDALLEALTSEAAGRLDQAVADGDLSEEEADRIRTELSEHLGALINGAGPFGGFGFDSPHSPGDFPFLGAFGGRFEIAFNPLETVAELTGTEPEDVIAALEDGQTLAEFAADSGVSEDELVAALMAETGERAAEAVANGDLSQAEADELLAMLDEHTRDMVNGTGFGIRHHDGPGWSGGFGPFGGMFAPGDCDNTDGGDDADGESTAGEI